MSDALTDLFEIKFFESQETDAGKRLDVFLAESLDSTRNHAQVLIAKNFVELNGATATKAGKSVKANDVVKVNLPVPVPIRILPQDIPLDIVYEDADLAVINKQQGLTVHPANGNYNNTLVNALLFHIKDLSGINGQIRPGIVHRLDKDTAGLMVVAKNDFAHAELARQIFVKECSRIYYALVEGKYKDDDGIIQQPIGRSRSDRKKMAVDYSGKPAVTLFHVVERFDNYTLVRFQLKTGRTHQIRVHTAFLGNPVVGDKTYGFKKQKFALDGQLLFSKIIGFTHPRTKEPMRFEADLPDYFKNVLNILRKTD